MNKEETKIIKAWALVGKLNPGMLSWYAGRPLIFDIKKRAILSRVEGDMIVKVEIKIINKKWLTKINI